MPSEHETTAPAISANQNNTQPATASVSPFAITFSENPPGSSTQNSPQASATPQVLTLSGNDPPRDGSIET